MPRVSRVSGIIGITSPRVGLDHQGVHYPRRNFCESFGRQGQDVIGACEFWPYHTTSSLHSRVHRIYLSLP
eukprot:6209226-Pleurochrysis_carterae.AAC.2